MPDSPRLPPTSPLDFLNGTPSYVMLASVESVSYALIAVESHFDLGHGDDIGALTEDIWTALRSHGVGH
jgi:hypothetical protein